MDLAGKTAVVTGASAGIGRATSVLLSSSGAHVVLVSRTRSRLEEVQRAIADRGGSASVLAADLRDLPSIDALARHVEERHGAADILVNAAGAWHDSERLFKGPSLDETPAEQIDHLFDVELRATIHVTRALLPAMKREGRGKIVQVGCGFAGPHEGVGWVHYYVAKRAVSAFTEALAAENRANGIQVNAVGPWFVRSEAVLRFFPDESRTALETDEVARTVAFLASDEASHISGQTIEIRSALDF
jgi:NAD(P)-dependent dehydrogenase (short-subunit alcohol dehydrogenase family)